MPSNRSRKNRNSRWSTGCAMLFALPFAAGGVAATGYCGWTLWQVHAMQSWVETPATLTKVDLDHDDESERVIAEYNYEFKGRKFSSNRVAVWGGGDNIGSFQRTAHRELKRHFDQKQPFHCFVNPHHPEQAVLYRQLRPEMIVFVTLFATTFGSVGLALLVGSLIASREEARNRNPDAPADEPWLARNDWASGRLSDVGGTSGLAVKILGLITAYWFVASAPLFVTLPAIFRQAGGFSKWFALAFPAVGMVLAFALGRQIVRRRKFGASVLELGAVPGVIGGQLVGVVRIPRFVETADGFRLKLKCEETIKKGEDNTTNVLWADEQIVREPMQDAAADVTAVPVLFAIPYDLPESSPPDDVRRVEWKLEATAEVPGVDYKSSFELPVFMTPESRRDFALDEGLTASLGPPPSTDEILSQAGIGKTLLSEGSVQLVFPAARQRRVALGVTTFALVGAGSTWWMISAGAPIIFPIVFGALDLLLVNTALDLWLYRSVIDASPSGLVFRGGWLGLGRERTYALADIASLETATQMSLGTEASVDIVLKDQRGRRRRIAKGLSSKLVERAVLAELNGALGRESTQRTVAADVADARR